MKKIVSLSFDVEEWDSPVYYGVESKDAMSTKFSAEGCAKIIELLEREKIRSTFFLTGTFARNHPDIAKKLASLGHDVACHGNDHKVLADLPYDELYADIKAGRDSVESASGAKVAGFRCPRNMRNPHLYEVLKKLSFTYDSSVHPAFMPGRWGDVLQKRDVHKVDGIIEVPSSTLIGLPISWWWMRNIGEQFTRIGCETSLRLHDYALVYFHAWEYAKLPQVAGIPSHMTKRTGIQFLEDLERLIGHLKKRGHCFGTIPDIIKQKTG
ncbi:MAG: polysaccharide deacetylase family protein [Candidatus Altiarchaeota archaeon]